jgi:hypothetical protein
MRKEIKIDPNMVEELIKFDETDESKLSLEFIEWSKNFNGFFVVQNEPAIHAKFIFKNLLENVENVEKFLNSSDRELQHLIAYLCKEKLFKISKSELNFEEHEPLLKLTVKLYEHKLITNITLRQILFKLGIDEEDKKADEINQALPKFCGMLKPITENADDPYFWSLFKMIEEMSEKSIDLVQER